MPLPQSEGALVSATSLPTYSTRFFPSPPHSFLLSPFPLRLSVALGARFPRCWEKVTLLSG